MVKILLVPSEMDPDKVIPVHAPAEEEQTVATNQNPGVAAPVATQLPHVSWLKRVGQVIGRIVAVVAKDAKPAADIATPVAEALLPQFAPEIAAADGLVTRIA